MSRRQKLQVFGSLLILILSFIGCRTENQGASVWPEETKSSPETDNPITPTDQSDTSGIELPAEVDEIGDCMWDAKAKAWLDTNENGRWDSNEQPLENIIFHIDDIYNSYEKVGDRAISNSMGEAELFVWLPGCPKVAFEVYVEATPDYKLTTPGRISARGEGPFLFGFIYLPKAAPTPQAVAPISCTSYSISGAYSTDIAIAPDDTLWITSDLSANHLAPFSESDEGEIAQSNESGEIFDPYVTTYTDADGLVDRYVTGVAIAPDNVVWVTTHNGVSRFDGSSWTNYRTENGLAANFTLDAAVAEDGSIWFVTVEGISQFNPHTQIWATYTQLGDFWHSTMSQLSVSPDGSLWLVTDTSIYQLIWPGPDKEAELLTHKKNEYDKRVPLEFLNDSSIAPDGTLWLSGSAADSPAIAHFNPFTQEWKVYTYQTTNGALTGDIITSIVAAPAGSVWIGTAQKGVVHLIPSLKATDQDIWLLFPKSDEMNFDYINDIAVDSKGIVWLTQPYKVTRCITDK